MNTPKNFFLQIGIIATLYASVVSFITFLFSVINKMLPDTGLDSYYYGGGSNFEIRTSVSVLIVMFPLFLWLSRLHRKNIVAHPEVKDSALRKWLLYFTLFIAGVTVAVDVIVLINSFLNGESLTAAFLLKVFVVLVVAIGIFYFYLQDIKGVWEANPKGVRTIAWTVGAVVLISIVSGILLTGSPANQRNVMQDQDRTYDLESIQYQITDYYQKKGKLPATLEAIVDPLQGNSLPKDPETMDSYKYEMTGALSFKLCATFDTASEGTPEDSQTYMYMGPQNNEFWKHGVGETCFDRTIDPERYPVYKDNPVMR